MHAPSNRTKRAAAAHDRHRLLFRLRIALWFHRGDAGRSHWPTGPVAAVPARRRLQGGRPVAAGSPPQARLCDQRRRAAHGPADRPGVKDSGWFEYALPASRTFYWIDDQDPAAAVAFAQA